MWPWPSGPRRPSSPLSPGVGMNSSSPGSRSRSCSRPLATGTPMSARASVNSPPVSSATSRSTPNSGRCSSLCGGFLGRADLQLHSDLGDGLSSIEEILDSAEKVGLNVIALTDHDDIRGAFELRELAARRSSPVEIVTGVEVTTRSGHLLALWIEDEIPMFCSLAQALARIHKAGGLAIVPHPLSYLTFSIGEGALRQLAASAITRRWSTRSSCATPP